MNNSHNVSPWTCPSCNSAVTTRYCPSCGEHPLHPRDHSLRGLFEQVFQVLSNIDSRLVRSFRYLLVRPGTLTVAYRLGQRKPYIDPFQLFILANVLFFAVQSLTGVRIFSTTLESHLHGQDWSALANQLLAQRLESLQTTLEAYSPLFNQAVALNAKSLIILMVLPFAVLPPILFRRNDYPFVIHVAFSLHFYAFLLLMFSAFSALASLDVMFGGRGLESTTLDHLLSVIQLALCALYLYQATGTTYGASGLTRVLQVAVLTVSAAVIVLGYRFALFLITLYCT